MKYFYIQKEPSFSVRVWSVVRRRNLDDPFNIDTRFTRSNNLYVNIVLTLAL